MSDPPVDYGMTKDNFKPKAPPLTEDELSVAKKDLIRTYPKVSRYKIDPPIAQQALCNVSFMLLSKPHKGVLGFFKPRGNWGDIEKATVECENLIGTVDSIFPIHQANVGYWNPITNNEEFTLDQMDVKTRDEDLAMRDRAAKENAVKNAQLAREMREVKEQIQQNKDNPIDENPDSLDYYTKKRVSQKELNAYINQANEKVRKLKKSLKKLNEEILKLNKINPKYIDQWLIRYNEERTKVGLPPVSESDLAKPNIIGSADD